MRRDAVERARHLLLPWSGMLGAGLGWAIADQAGSDLVTDHCTLAHPLLMVLIGLVGLGIAALGGLTSWRAHRSEEGARRFLAVVGALMAALFSIAIFLQTSATLFLPRCYG